MEWLALVWQTNHDVMVEEVGEGGRGITGVMQHLMEGREVWEA